MWSAGGRNAAELNQPCGEMTASAIRGPEAAISRDLSETRIAAGLERHQPPPGRGRDCWFVAAAGTRSVLLLLLVVGLEQNQSAGRASQ
jgi:hypothetical protein